MWWEEHGSLKKCILCPHNCLIAEGKRGRCGVRTNDGSAVRPLFYGKAAALNIDPIEKKPLYHFHPGESILSIGGAGCNFNCFFCQNHEISQHTDIPMRDLSPQQLVDMMGEAGCRNIAFTYNEPLIHYEYVYDTFVLAKKKKYFTALVTNGYINKAPLVQMLGVCDAWNIDLKFLSEEDYKKNTSGSLKSVKQTISMAVARAHVEVTTLVIPGLNDDPAAFASIAEFLAVVSPWIPWHLSRYFPNYKSDIPATPFDDILHLYEIAKKHIKYVFTGNMHGQDSSSFCPSCGEKIIDRRNYFTKVINNSTICTACGNELKIVF